MHGLWQVEGGWLGHSCPQLQHLDIQQPFTLRGVDDDIPGETAKFFSWMLKGLPRLEYARLWVTAVQQSFRPFDRDHWPGLRQKVLDCALQLAFLKRPADSAPLKVVLTLKETDQFEDLVEKLVDLAGILALRWSFPAFGPWVEGKILRIEDDVCGGKIVELPDPAWDEESEDGDEDDEDEDDADEEDEDEDGSSDEDDEEEDV